MKIWWISISPNLKLDIAFEVNTRHHNWKKVSFLFNLSLICALLPKKTITKVKKMTNYTGNLKNTTDLVGTLVTLRSKMNGGKLKWGWFWNDQRISEWIGQQQISRACFLGPFTLNSIPFWRYNWLRLYKLRFFKISKDSLSAVLHSQEDRRLNIS